MTLQDIVALLERTAGNQPAVRTIVPGDVFRLNAMPSVRYGVFAWVQGQHTATIDGRFITFRFSLFYVDRLTEAHGNQVEVQSVGIETLQNVLRTLQDEGVDVDQPTFQPFNQRFADECAGVYTTVGLTVPVEWACADIYEK